MPDLMTHALNDRLAFFSVGSLAIMQPYAFTPEGVPSTDPLYDQIPNLWGADQLEVVILNHVLSMIDGTLQPRIKVLVVRTSNNLRLGVIGETFSVGPDNLTRTDAVGGC
jgi:hypothetical protein